MRPNHKCHLFSFHGFLNLGNSNESGSQEVVLLVEYFV